MNASCLVARSESVWVALQARPTSIAFEEIVSAKEEGLLESDPIELLKEKKTWKSVANLSGYTRISRKNALSLALLLCRWDSKTLDSLSSLRLQLVCLYQCNVQMYLYMSFLIICPIVYGITTAPG